MNGTISYSPNTVPNYSLGTSATYSCNEGFFLEVMDGSSKIRTCEDDNNNDAEGEWSNIAPACVRKLLMMKTILVSYNANIILLQLSYVPPSLVLTMVTSITLPVWVLVIIILALWQHIVAM